MRILVPLDGSQLAERALEPAVHLLRHAPPPHDLILVRAITGSLSDNYLLYTYPDPHTALLLGEAAEATYDYLRQIAQRPLPRGIHVTPIVRQGDPAQIISELAQERQVDLTVLTSHGRTGIVRMALGSVAADVARLSQIPTLLVRPEGQTFPDNGRAIPLTLLVPLDGSELAETAIEPAARIAKTLRGAIRLVRVVPAAVEHPDEQRERNREAYAYLTVFHDQLEAQGIITHRSIAWGKPAEQIAAEAQRHQVDLVVIATHGRTGMERVLKGSVTEAILHSMRLPVIVTHPLTTPATQPIPQEEPSRLSNAG
jgi:nucleotide-binding universal stress UspA family protein